MPITAVECDLCGSEVSEFSKGCYEDYFCTKCVSSMKTEYEQLMQEQERWRVKKDRLRQLWNHLVEIDGPFINSFEKKDA